MISRCTLHMQMCLRPSLCAAAELLLLPPALCEGWWKDPRWAPPLLSHPL